MKNSYITLPVVEVSKLMHKEANTTSSEPKKVERIASFKSTCPVCGSNTFRINSYIYEVPLFGKILLLEGKCSTCGYRYSDVKTIEQKKPKKIIVHVTGENELRYLILKSATAALKIKETGYEMVPGPASQGFITTIEGILFRFEEALNVICSEGEHKDVCRKHREWLTKAVEGREKFTLIICDFEGTSSVAGERVVYKDLDEECYNLIK